MRKTWDAAAAKTARERKHRIKRVRSMLTRVRPVLVPPDKAIGAPMMKARTPAGLWIDAAVGFKFRRSDLDTIGEKFVRGLTDEVFF